MTDMEMQEKDYDWFLTNYDDLFQKYGVSYLAIKNKKVLGQYASFVDAITETDKTERAGSYIVQYCNGKETGHTNYISSMFVIGA